MALQNILNYFLISQSTFEPLDNGVTKFFNYFLITQSTFEQMRRKYFIKRFHMRQAGIFRMLRFSERPVYYYLYGSNCRVKKSRRWKTFLFENGSSGFCALEITAIL